VFTLESALSLPDGTPGDLVIPGQTPLEASVVSIDGLSITLSLSTDAGELVPSARFESRLVHVLSKLIERIEHLAELENPAGARVLGRRAPEGAPLRDRLDGLDASQAEAVASALGRDTTVIWGPPGTDRTQTIGTIGEELWKAGRPALMLSHTNAAVDEALLHIADALGEQAEDGSVLRLGEPKDLRLFERPRLLAETHVHERAAILEAEDAELRAERAGAQMEIRDRLALIALADWLARGAADLERLRADAARIGKLAEAREHLEGDLSELEVEEPVWRERIQAAEAIGAASGSEATLAAATSNASARVTARRAEVWAATANRDEARSLHQQTERANPVTRRFRRLPDPDDLAAVVQSREGELESVHGELERAEHELRDLTRDLAAARARLAAFTAEYGDSPAAVLAEARAYEQRLDATRAAARDARREAEQAALHLEEELSERWTLLQQRGLVGGAPSPVEDRIDALAEARPGAAEEVGDRDPHELEAEIHGFHERVRVIELRLEAIAEERSRIEDAVIGDARIVATTLTSACLSDSIQNRRFDSVILDEASMAPIPALWVAAATADRNVVLAGDFLQPPPVKHSEHPHAERWLGRDIFHESGLQVAHGEGGQPEHLVVLREQHDRDGLVVCASPGCGKPVQFGFWGDEPHWRCSANPRHRQPIARTHLELPGMRALVPASELRKLDEQFPRPIDVLLLLARHKTRKEIAETLGLTIETVKTYLEDLYQELGVHNRTDAVRVARDTGLL
jgi:DNA-binding CsgD family transcriptional regulator